VTHRQRLVAATVAAVIATHLLGRSALGDPPPAPDLSHYVHLESSSHVTTDGGSTLTLPPGYFFDAPTYSAVDAEFHRLQDAETRLTAENKSMRASLASWEPGWYVLGGAVLSALALGWELRSKL
jgi:hypothetical protein